MSNALTPTTPPSLPQLPEKFANPLRQIQAVFAQPAVRRSLPMVMLVGLVAAAALAWMTFSTPPQKTLFAELADADKASVTQALTAAGITSHIDNGTGALTVGDEDYSKARMLLASQGLPKATPAGYAILDQLPMGVSRAVEGERLRQARETELARSIEEIDTVAEARVHLATPEASVFVRDNAAPSASVILKLQPGRALSDAQVASIRNLVASSVPGMKPDAVTIVDQMGGLLTKGDGDGSGNGGDDANDKRLRLQRQMEDKYREQLNQLLTPLVGAGNFSAEIQADIDLNETQATKETFDKQGALRAEQGQWTRDGAGQQPGGIPGALSNTPPAAATVTAPQATPTPAPGAAPAPGSPQATAGAVAGAVTDAMKQSDQYARSYDLGKEVSVSRVAPGSVKRLSVAVLLRDPEGAKPRSQAEITQITNLVRAAVGFDQNRNDNVTVISRKFAGSSDDSAKAAWYDNAWVPMLARNLTAIVIALLVLLLGVRPLAKALLKKREDATPKAPALGAPMGGATDENGVVLDNNGEVVGSVDGPPVSIDQLVEARNFDDRVGMVRGFTRDNPARAALAVRDMIAEGR